MQAGISGNGSVTTRRNGRNERGNCFAGMSKKPEVVHMLVDLVPVKPAVTFLVTAQDNERNSAAARNMYLNDKDFLDNWCL